MKLREGTRDHRAIRVGIAFVARSTNLFRSDGTDGASRRFLLDELTAIGDASSSGTLTSSAASQKTSFVARHDFDSLKSGRSPQFLVREGRRAVNRVLARRR
jgi:hypothetical protein